MEQTQKTEWLPHGAFGVSEYKVWKRFSNGAWHQRHEFKMQDGKIELTEWINSNEGFFK